LDRRREKGNHHKPATTAAREAAPVEPNHRKGRYDGGNTETEQTCYHHQNSTGDLDDSGAEGKGRSSHHHPSILHHINKVWIENGEIMKISRFNIFY
jgi:hypothetical protein